MQYQLLRLFLQKIFFAAPGTQPIATASQWCSPDCKCGGLLLKMTLTEHAKSIGCSLGEAFFFYAQRAGVLGLSTKVYVADADELFEFEGTKGDFCDVFLEPLSSETPPHTIGPAGCHMARMQLLKTVKDAGLVEGEDVFIEATRCVFMDDHLHFFLHAKEKSAARALRDAASPCFRMTTRAGEIDETNHQPTYKGYYTWRVIIKYEAPPVHIIRERMESIVLGMQPELNVSTVLLTNAEFFRYEVVIESQKGGFLGHLFPALQKKALSCGLELEEPDVESCGVLPIIVEWADCTV